jgi:hypothetical protein
VPKGIGNFAKSTIGLDRLDDQWQQVNVVLRRCLLEPFEYSAALCSITSGT